MAMQSMGGKGLVALLWLCCVIICVSSSLAQTTCKSYRFSGNQTFQSCTDLPLLDSSIHWTYSPIPMTAHIALIRKIGTSKPNLIVWSLQTMLGSQALVAFHNSSALPTAYTTQNGSLTFRVSNISAAYGNNNEMVIFATLHLDNALIKITNQVWLEGPMSRTNFTMLPMSGPNKTIDFSSGGKTVVAATSSTTTKKKNVHAVLNMVSWGIMLPVGAMLANSVKALEVHCPPLICLRVLWGTSTYAIGVAGWATGMNLGSESHGITHDAHRILGILLFCFSTLQLFYETPPVYVTIVISIINIYQGLDILQPDPKWKKMYTGFLIFLGSIYVVCSIIECLVGVCLLSSSSGDRAERATNGSVRSNNASVPLLS